VNSFFERHQTKLIGAMILAGAIALIWLDEQKHRAPVGAAAPDVTFQMLDGSPDVALASLKGKPVVLDFWATWCGPCRASLPHIAALSKKYEGRAHIIAVNAENESAGLQQRTLEQLRVSMPVATNGLEAAATYKVEVLPTTVVLDSEGKLIDSFSGVGAPDRVDRLLEKLQ
jgi:thiol-disulfide isomerase/thioredoxin